MTSRRAVLLQWWAGMAAGSHPIVKCAYCGASLILHCQDSRECTWLACEICPDVHIHRAKIGDPS